MSYSVRKQGKKERKILFPETASWKSVPSCPVGEFGSAMLYLAAFREWWMDPARLLHGVISSLHTIPELPPRTSKSSIHRSRHARRR